MALLLGILCFLVPLLGAIDLILTPPNSKSGAPVGLIYIVGADIEPLQYVPLCQSLQDAFSKPLYVGIPSFIAGFASVDEFVNILPTLLKQMEKKGLPNDSSIFMAGHSLGGAVLQSFSAIYQTNFSSVFPNFIYQGQILNAAVITHKFRDPNNQLVVNYTTPTLTISGEMDGNLRVSRVIEQFYIQLIKNKTSKNEPFVNNETLLEFPIIIVDGMSHMQFASGQIPENVLDKDLIPEISYADAYNVVSKYMSCWMSLLLDDNNNTLCSFDDIYSAVYDSQTLANPFIAGFIAEGSYWFEQPCDCDPLICQNTDICQGGAPWMDDNIYDVNDAWIPQEIMCGFGDKGNASIKVKQVNTDSFHPTYQVNPVHYANIWNKCGSIDDENCILNTSTVSQNIYPPADRVDTGGGSSSAIEMRHKMKSRQSCYEQVNGGAVEEDFEICGKINQHSIDWAIKRAPEKTLKRYQEFGEYLTVGPDIYSKTGTNWTYEALHETRRCNQSTHRYYTAVESNYLYLKTLANGCKFKPETECGVHYCKILSPAHVMEWLYTDGLRFNLSIANQNKTVNITC